MDTEKFIFLTILLLEITVGVVILTQEREFDKIERALSDVRSRLDVLETPTAGTTEKEK